MQPVSLGKRSAILTDEFIESQMSRRKFIDFAVLRCNIFLFEVDDPFVASAPSLYSSVNDLDIVS